MRQGNLAERRGVLNCERLAVTEWQRERGTTKKRRRRCWRSGTSRNHPEEYPGEERLRGACLLRGLVLWTVGCFLAVPIYLIF